MVPPRDSPENCPVAEDDPVTIRMFAGYADTPLWSSGGPVALADLDLPHELRAGLARWETESYGGDGMLSGMTPPCGNVLAEWLAQELGADIVVRLQVSSPEDSLVFRSEAPPRSPSVAALLLREAADDRALRGAMSPGRWYARAPLAGEVLHGHPNGSPSRGWDADDDGTGPRPPRLPSLGRLHHRSPGRHHREIPQTRG